MNRATIVRADGTVEELDRRPTLKEAQQVVGGWIELVKTKDGRVLVVNEEGKMLNLPRNGFASSLYHGNIVGDVLVLEGWRTVG